MSIGLRMLRLLILRTEDNDKMVREKGKTEAAGSLPIGEMRMNLTKSL
jgi:hypothetical protein